MEPASKSALLVLTATVFATPTNAEGQWTTGVMVTAETGYYTGTGDDVLVLPYLAYDSDKFHFGVTDGLAYHFASIEGQNGNGGRFSAVLRPRWEPGLRDTGPFAVLDRDIAVEAGLSARYNIHQSYFAEAEALADLSGVHEGYEVSGAVGFMYAAKRFSFEGRVGARYRSEDLNQYLFGVSADEATAQWAAFTAGDGVTGFARLTVSYGISKNIALVGDLTFEDFGGLTKSPLVENSTNSALSLGILYQF